MAGVRRIVCATVNSGTAVNTEHHKMEVHEIEGASTWTCRRYACTTTRKRRHKRIRPSVGGGKEGNGCCVAVLNFLIG